MAAASGQRLVSRASGPSSLVRGSSREAQHSSQRIVPCSFLTGLGISKGFGSWKSSRRRAGVSCSSEGSESFGLIPRVVKLPLGSFLGELRENNKDVKWALDYWDMELEDGYRSLDEWKGQLLNLRQGNPTIKWAFDYWDKELEDGYKSLDDWGAQLADIQAGNWLSRLRADNPDVKWALDYWDQELIDGYKSLDEWKAQAADIGSFLSANPLYVAVGVAAVFLPILLFLKLNKGYAGNLSANEAFAKLNKEDGAVLVDVRSKEEKGKEGSPKLGRKVLAVAFEDAGTSAEEELRTAVKGRVPDQGSVVVVLDSAGATAPQAAKIVSGEGYSRVYVVTGGAEGPQGWRESQLPWRTPQTFTLDLGEIKDALTSTIQDLQEYKQVLPATLGVAAAAGVSLILFAEAETALQLLGSAAAVQVFVKKLLFAKDREETIRQLQNLLDTKIAPKGLEEDLEGLSTTLISKSEATVEAEAAAATPVSISSEPEAEPEAEIAPSAKGEEGIDPEATEEVIPEANVPDFVNDEGGVVGIVGKVESGEPKGEYGIGEKEEGNTEAKASVSDASEDGIPDAKEEDAPAAEKRGDSVLEGPVTGAKAELEAAEAVIPEANVEDYAGMPGAVAVGTRAERGGVEEVSEKGVDEVAEKNEEVSAVAEERKEKAEAAEDALPEDGVKNQVSNMVKDKVPVGVSDEVTDKTSEEAKHDQPASEGPEAMFKSVKEAAGEGLERVEGFAGGVVEGASSAADGVKSGAQDLAAAVEERFDTSRAEEVSVKDETTSSDTSAFGQVATEEPDGVSEPVSESVTRAAQQPREGVKDHAGAVKETVGDKAEDIGDAVSEAVSGPAQEVKEVVREAAEPISGAAEGVSEGTDNVEESEVKASEATEMTTSEDAAPKEVDVAASEDPKVWASEEKAEEPEEEAPTEGDETKAKEAARAIKQALAPGTEETAPEAGVITLLYESGWDKAFLHFSADGGSWTELPGEELGFDTEENAKVIRVPASSIQFVLTDGAGDWDTPPYGGNYFINSSGTYKLSSGWIAPVEKVEKQ